MDRSSHWEWFRGVVAAGVDGATPYSRGRLLRRHDPKLYSVINSPTEYKSSVRPACVMYRVMQIEDGLGSTVNSAMLWWIANSRIADTGMITWSHIVWSIEGQCNDNGAALHLFTMLLAQDVHQRSHLSASSSHIANYDLAHAWIGECMYG
jgi:hypothetical protein